MSGTVGIIANDSARFTLFASCLLNLQTPRQTYVSWAVGSDRIYGRNRLVRAMLDTDSEWLFFLDDDHAFPPDALMRLLKHDVGIVASLYMGRARPFVPIAYMKEDGLYSPIDLTDQPADGMLEIHAAGTGGMLIRREVFEKMPEPWFEHNRASEDLIFCDAARELGFPVYLDLGAHMGHLAPCSIWPAHVDGEWAVGFTVSDGTTLYAEIAKPGET